MIIFRKYCILWCLMLEIFRVVSILSYSKYNKAIQLMLKLCWFIYIVHICVCRNDHRIDYILSCLFLVSHHPYIIKPVGKGFTSSESWCTEGVYLAVNLYTPHIPGTAHIHYLISWRCWLAWTSDQHFVQSQISPPLLLHFM